MVLVALFSIGAGVWLLADFWPAARGIWWGLQHDRNAHFLQGLKLGMGVRQLDWVSVGAELERMQVWGIVHAFLLGLIQLLAGPDHRLAVVPSLIMWCGSIAIGFMLA
jgi:hypothetical protein